MRRLPVGYLDDVMLFYHFTEAWERFQNAESAEQEKMAKEHPLYEICREIHYAQQGERSKKLRKKKT